MPTTEAQKRATKKWNLANKERYREIQIEWINANKERYNSLNAYRQLQYFRYKQSFSYENAVKELLRIKL